MLIGRTTVDDGRHTSYCRSKCILRNYKQQQMIYTVIRRFAPCFILKGEKQDVEDETPLV